VVSDVVSGRRRRSPRLRTLTGVAQTTCATATTTLYTEIGLLAAAAGVATHRAPFLAILSLPTLFAAGMSLVDTAEGAFMSHAYGWAFASPVRKLYYNITVTSLSVAAALVIGMIELLQATAGLRALDLGRIGHVVVALLFATWAFSLAYWKFGRVEERWTTSHA